MADDKPTGKIAAIAPRFSLPGLESHQPLMSIRRDQLKKNLTNVRPLFRKIDDSKDSDLLRMEWLVWDLAECHVEYDVSGKATVEGFDGDKFLNLVKLENLQGRVDAAFSQAALTPSQRGRSSAVITLSAGQGTASHVLPFRREFWLVTSRDASHNSDDHPVPNPENPLTVDPFDILDVTVDLPKNQDTLTIKLTRTDGSHGKITVATQRRDPVTGDVTEFVPTVCFSHLCSQLPRVRRFDLEFAQYYDMLTANPHDTGLVPCEVPRGGSAEGDCDFFAVIDYQLSPPPKHPPKMAVPARKKAKGGKKIKTRKKSR